MNREGEMWGVDERRESGILGIEVSMEGLGFRWKD